MRITYASIQFDSEYRHSRMAVQPALETHVEEESLRALNICEWQELCAISYLDRRELQTNVLRRPKFVLA